jgi:hypothetical protein
MVYASQKGGTMTKNELKQILDGMPQGMDVDDFLLEVVNRALFLERNACIKAIEDEVQDWDRDMKEAALEASEVIRERGKK